MANRNISATVQIGATMASSVGAVFGRLDKQIDALGGSLAKIKRQSSDIAKLQTAQGKLGEAKAKGNAAATARYAAQVDKLSASLAEAGVDTSQLTKEQARLAQSIAKTEQQLGKFKHVGAVFSRLKTDAKGVGDAFGGLRDKLGSAFSRLGVAAGIVGGAVAGVSYLTSEFVDQGDALADQAEALNISTEALQTWQFAAGTVGIESEKLGAILSKLQTKISEGSDGTKEAFGTLGISFSKIGKLKPEEQLTHIAEAFSRLPDTVNKTALANNVFGKSGYKLLPVLNAGAAGLKDIYEQAKATGYILDGDTNDAVNKADAAFNQFKLQLIGFKNKSLAPLLPVFGEMIGQLGKIITEHGPKFTRWIQTSGKEFMEKLAPAIGSFVTNDLPPLIDNIGKVVTGLASTSSWLANVVGGWQNLGIALVAVNFVPVIASVVSLTAALWKLSAPMLAALGPMGLVVAGLGLIAGALWMNQSVVEDYIRESTILRAYVEGMVNSFEWLNRTWESTVQLIEDGGTAWVNTFNSIIQTVDSLLAKISKLTSMNLGSIGGAMLDFNPITGPSRLAGKALETLMPSDKMPNAGGVGTVNNNVNVQISAPNSDGPGIERHLRANLPKVPLYDTTGTLVPQ